MSNVKSSADEIAVHGQESERYYTRFNGLQKCLHTVLFIAFLGLAATGLPMRFSTNIWAQKFALYSGGFGVLLWVHKICGVALTIAFLVNLKDLAERVLIKKEKGIFWGPTSMVPNFKDAGDMLKNFAWFVGLGEKPKIERYAYWEKFDYWAVFWGVTIIGSSGYAMWFAPFFARFLPGWALNAAQIIHSEEALLAVMFIFSIHFINAHLRPDCFPMDMAIFTGKITEEEFKTRHPQEFERLKAEGKLDEKLTTKPEKSLIVLSQVIGFLAIAVGLILLVLTVVAYFRE